MCALDLSQTVPKSVEGGFLERFKKVEQQGGCPRREELGTLEHQEGREQTQTRGFLESRVVRSKGRGQSHLDVSLSLADHVTLDSLQ